MKNYRILIFSLLLLGNMAYAEQQTATQALAPVAFESHALSKGFRSWTPFLPAALSVIFAASAGAWTRAPQDLIAPHSLVTPVSRAPEFMKLSAPIAPVEVRREINAQDFFKNDAFKNYVFPPIENFSPKEQAMIEKAFALIRQFASEGKGKSAEAIARFLKDRNYDIHIFKTEIGKISRNGKPVAPSWDMPDGISFLMPIGDDASRRVMVFGIDPMVFESEVGMARVINVVTKEVLGRAKSATVLSEDFHEQEASAYDATIDFLNWLLKNKNNLVVTLSENDYNLLVHVALPYEKWWRDYSKEGRLDVTALPAWPIHKKSSPPNPDDKPTAPAVAAAALSPAFQAKLDAAMEKSKIPSESLESEVSELRDRFELLYQLDGLDSAEAVVTGRHIVENQLAHPLGLQALMTLFMDVSGGENPSTSQFSQFTPRKEEIRYLVLHFVIAMMENAHPSRVNTHVIDAFWTPSDIVDGVAPIARDHQWSDITAFQEKLVSHLVWVLQRTMTRFTNNAFVTGNEATWALAQFDDARAQDALESALDAYKRYAHDAHEELSHSPSMKEALDYRVELTKFALNSLKKRKTATSGLLKSPHTAAINSFSGMDWDLSKGVHLEKFNLVKPKKPKERRLKEAA